MTLASPRLRSRAGRSLRRAVATAACAALALTGAAVATPAVAASADTVQIDFSERTGPFRGGASGMLYGLGDEGVPTDAIIAGARPSNVTQKAPRGAQHPNGDPLEVEGSFFRNGGDYLMVNIQDYYPDWPYNGGKRPEDFESYLDIVRTVVTDIRDNSAYPERYVFTPFNEPDGINWYGQWDQMKDHFVSDWDAAYRTIKEIMPEARIAGPGDAWWHGGSTREILQSAKASGTLPDIWTWHELGVENLRTFRGHLAEFRRIEQEVGVGPLPVNITEYAMRRDMSVPGQIVQWLAMFEDAKVDAQTAYWTFAGNLNDNMAKGGAANGAWWLLKWYGDLSGDTVQLTPPQLNAVDTVQGIATIDDERRQATVLVGGGSSDIQLDLAGLDPDVFGSTVDVQVRESSWTGQEGEAQAPRVVAAERVTLSDALAVTVPNDDRQSAYQVVITPALGEEPVVDDTWRTEIEAEDAALRSLQVNDRPADDAWVFAASGQKDVTGFTRADASVSWDVEVPEDGDYRFAVIVGVGGPGSHAVFVDDEPAATLAYEPGFNTTYRGRAEAMLTLDAGAHTISVRASSDGSSVLPGADVSLDRLELERVDGAETHDYPAFLARTDAAPAASGTVPLSPDAGATFFVSARESGYHDVDVRYETDGPASVQVSLNGRAIEGAAAEHAGRWTSTLRVHLREGINQISVTADAAQLAGIRTTRVAEADEAVTRIEVEDAERVTLAGGVRRENVSAPTNVSGEQIGWLGGGAANTATIARGEALPAGDYDLQVRYSNAEKNTGHAYNADIITRFLDVSEVGGETARGSFRHNYSWKGFWTHSMPVTLSTESGDIVLGNATSYAPNLDWVALAPLSLAVTNVPAPPSESATLEVVSPPVKTRYVIGEAFAADGLAVAVRDGERIIPVAEDAYSLQGFESTTAGQKTITVAAEIAGRPFTTTFTVEVVEPEPEPEPGADPAMSLSSSTVAQGGTITVTGSGLPASAAAEVWLHSDPVLLADAATDADGALTATVTIPARTPVGSHEIVVRVAGVELRADLAVTASGGAPAPGAPSSDPLASTGGQIAWGAGALAALLLVAGGILVARRRGSVIER
jgi:hypothetical protein